MSGVQKGYRHQYCGSGRHPMDGDNVGLYPNGQRFCHQCDRERKRAYKRRNRKLEEVLPEVEVRKYPGTGVLRESRVPPDFWTSQIRRFAYLDKDECLFVRITEHCRPSRNSISRAAARAGVAVATAEAPDGLWIYRMGVHRR